MAIRDWRCQAHSICICPVQATPQRSSKSWIDVSLRKHAIFKTYNLVANVESHSTFWKARSNDVDGVGDGSGFMWTLRLGVLSVKVVVFQTARLCCIMSSFENSGRLHIAKVIIYHHAQRSV